MTSSLKFRRYAGALALVSATALVTAGCSSSDPEPSGSGTPGANTEPVTFSWLVDDTDSTRAWSSAMVEAYTAKHPNVTITIETRPGGAEGDNIVKTKLATGEMNDLFFYNAGSLLQALNPVQTLVPLTDEPFMDVVSDTFKAGVTGSDGNVYGVPLGAGMGGGIFYNIPLYERLGLSVPKTWDEFMANNAAILADGKAAPVIQTYKDTWTSQLFVLGDNFNVMAENPNFAADYTANKANYSNTPAALKSFQNMQDIFDAGYLNKDYASANLDDGMRMVATGEGAHYPMLTFAVSNLIANNPDKVDDVGFFAIPGTDASKNGLTTWLSAGLYIPISSQHPDAVKDFLAFVATPEACDIQTKAAGAQGPYFIKGCTLPADVPRAVADLNTLVTEGQTAPALEFLSPVKGPALEQILVEVGSGIRPAVDGAALYDEDVKKQAQQLGLPGW